LSDAAMKAYVLEGLTGIGALTPVQRAVPVMRGPDDVRVRIVAASLNARDLAVAAGAFAAMTAPDLIPLSDGAGEVVDCGPGVWRVRPGDRVALTFNPDWIGGAWEPSPGALGRGGGIQGVLCEEVVIDQRELVRLPDHLSFEEGACLPCAGVTAWTALRDVAPLLPGETVLIQGTGGVSRLALMFAKVAGARVIGIASSAEKAALMTADGADHVIDRIHETDWDQAAVEASKGGVDLVIDVGGAATQARSVGALRQGGRLAIVGMMTGLPAGDGGAGFMKGARQSVIRVGSRQDFEAMLRCIDLHRLRPPIDRVFPFDQAREALAYLASAAHAGKVVIRVGA